jgi:aminopeptidase N
MKRTLLLFAALSGSSLGAQRPLANPNLERVANDAYTRSHDYDLIHQRIAVRDFDWDSTSFTGSVTTTLVALRPAFDSVVLDAGSLLAVRRVVAPNGGALRFARHGDTLVVHLARPAAFRDTVRFTVDYDGKVRNGRGLTFITERSHVPRQIWSQGEDSDNHLWFPTYDFPNDKMTWDLEATVPAEDFVVSNGRLISDTRDLAGGHTIRWSQERPSASYLVSLVVAPLARIHDVWHGVPVDYYVYHADSSLARALFKVTPDMIDVYSALTGVPYPWAKYAQTTVADFFGGMENVSATTLVDWLPDPRAYQDRPWYQYILIPHELAHQWFGDYVTTANWANMWLNEGFAEFMPGQYWGRKLGAHAEQEYYADEYNQYMGIESRRPMPLAALASNNIYPKGALVLEMLERYLGSERFWVGIHAYLTAHALGPATTDDLRQAFLDATGENLDWFFNEWMYSAGYPSFTVTAAYDSAAHRVTVIARQTQRDSLRADSAGMRYPIPETFRMPINIRIGTAGGDVVHNAWVRQREDTVVVDSVTSVPTMVVFDDGDRILKGLTFDQPTAWLATQLSHDTNLWNREWVLGQLAQRRTDPAAAAAVANAVTSADHPRTRALAVSAIDAFPSDVSLPAVDRALRDTSSTVRAAAATALGAIGGQRAVDLARAAWHGDSSYSVRASAFSALMRLDSAGRSALIAEGLHTPSYHDAIQNAALAAVARADDASFDDQLQPMVGEQQMVSQVLGARARRGDQHALDLLVSDLNDQRAYVRRWALGMVRTLPKDRALETLKAAQPRLTYPDMQRAVGQAIAQMNQ